MIMMFMLQHKRLYVKEKVSHIRFKRKDTVMNPAVIFALGQLVWSFF